MLAKGIGGDDLIHGVSPATIIDHQMAELLGNHVVEHIVGNLGMVLGLCEEGLDVIALVINLGEECLLVFAGIKVLNHTLLTVCALVGNVQRGSDNNLVKLLNFAVDSDEDLAIFALDFVNGAVENGGVLQMVVQLFPNILGAFFPGPEVDLDKVHAGLEVKVLQDVSGRDFIKIAITEGGKGSDPDLLNQGNAILLAEFFKRECQVLQVGVHTLDLLTARCYSIAVIAAFRNAAVTVDIITLVLGLQQLTELLELTLHLQHPGVLDNVADRSGKGLNHIAGGVFVIAVEFRAVVGDAAEFLHVMDGIVRGNTHNGAHLITASIVVRRPALAADTVEPFINGIVFIALFLQIHACAEAGRATADDCDANILIHVFPPK